MHRTISSLSPDSPRLSPGKHIVAALAALKYEIQHDRALTPLPSNPGSSLASVDAYNAELAALGSPTWFNCPWLFAECYMYRRIACILETAGGPEWRNYDVFARQKSDALRSSRRAVLELAARYREVMTALRTTTDGKATVLDEAKSRQLFCEFADICLWGNASDLSLLASLSVDNLQQGEQARQKAEDNILVNDVEQVYELLLSAKQAGTKERRIDIVLDNSAFELFVDLVLAGYLLAAGLATQVVLYPKDMPWFVSDVTPADFGVLLNALAEPTSFFDQRPEGDVSDETLPVPLSEEAKSDIGFLFQEWSKLYAEGGLLLRPHSFWTEGGSFWRLPYEAPDLFEDLKGGLLSIWKGDLNYRKLVADVRQSSI